MSNKPTKIDNLIKSGILDKLIYSALLVMTGISHLEKGLDSEGISSTGLEERAQSLKHLILMHKDLSSTPQHRFKKTKRKKKKKPLGMVVWEAGMVIPALGTEKQADVWIHWPDSQPPWLPPG